MEGHHFGYEEMKSPENEKKEGDYFGYEIISPENEIEGDHFDYEGVD